MRGYIVMMGLCLLAIASMGQSECGHKSSDQTQREQQERILAEVTAQTGMPAIVNFRERKLMKDILELRDQDGLTTYTYTFSEQTGQLRLLCVSIGYPIPYATQYTNPEKPIYSQGVATMPQADPNGLFSPASAEGSWVMCNDPTGKGARVIYAEPRVVVSPFKLD